MNDFRALYLPASDWSDKPQQLLSIAEELEDDFDLVLEWPHRKSAEECESLLGQLAPLKNNIACIVIVIQDKRVTSLESLFSRLSKHYVLSLRSENAFTDEQLALAKQHGVGIVWQPQRFTEPVLVGTYQVVCLPCLGLREIRGLLERLSELNRRNTPVGIFIEPHPQSTARALETRTLLELLELA